MRCDVQNNSKRMHCYSEDESALTANCNNFWCGNSWVSFFNLSSVENVGCFIRSLQIFHIHTHKIHVCKMWKRWTYYHFWYKLNCKPNAHDVSFGIVFFDIFCERFCLAFDLSFAFCKFHSVFFLFILSLLDKRVVLFWKYIFIFL